MHIAHLQLQIKPIAIMDLTTSHNEAAAGSTSKKDRQKAQKKAQRVRRRARNRGALPCR